MKGRQRIIKDRSKGALALAHSGASTDQIARTLGATDASVNYWISGEKAPGGPFRKKLRSAYWIPVIWWEDQAPPEDETWIAEWKHGLAKLRGDGGDVLAKIRGASDKAITAAIVGSELTASVPEVVTTAKDVRDLAGQYLDQVRMFMSTVQTDKLLTMTEKARTLRECSAALDKAGRLTGASAEIPVSKILKSPAWAKLGKIIADAIAADGDPKAAARTMRRVGEALKGAE